VVANHIIIGGQIAICRDVGRNTWFWMLHGRTMAKIARVRAKSI
jgi:hypothetical protein